jgi:hypothetical protein
MKRSRRLALVSESALHQGIEREFEELPEVPFGVAFADDSG